MIALQSFVRESSWYIGSAESLDPSFRGIAESSFFHLTDPNITYSVLAFFLTAGVFSMFGSHASHTVRLMRAKRKTSDIKALSKVRHDIRPSLGASGAVYSTLVLTALAVPDTAVQLLFLPFLIVPIKVGAAGLVTMDTVGIIRGWRIFDHYGHLSGAAFGGAYFFGGPYLWPRTGQFLPLEKPLPKA
jgi:membrane associated rhomboid family serine protease